MNSLQSLSVITSNRLIFFSQYTLCTKSTMYLTLIAESFIVYWNRTIPSVPYLGVYSILSVVSN